MKPLNGFNGSGIYSIGDNTEVAGDLHLNGKKTTLSLFSKNFFSTSKITENHILGSLHDLTKVSLIRPITIQDSGIGFRGSEKYHFSTIFPHIVIFGPAHISSKERIIEGLSFEITDAHIIFHDPSVFGETFDNLSSHISLITEASQSRSQKITPGEFPRVFYYTGKQEIFNTETKIGKISATHAQSYKTPGTQGIKVDNTIFINIEFKNPETVEDAMRSVTDLLRFLEILAGRPQSVTHLTFSTHNDKKKKEVFDVYWCSNPPPEHIDTTRGPDPQDIPVQVAREPENFRKIFTHWMARNNELREARARFSSCFSQQQSYSIDRLVGAANMFDILPPSVTPSDVTLSEEIIKARDDARILFRGLNISPERDSILNALGRIGKASLKRKIRARAENIIKSTEAQFPNLNTVLDEAVNCRNHFVHGSPTKINYLENFEQVIFFTNALEFVFAASDLTDCGWNITLWAQKWSTLSHPFDQFLKTYEDQLNNLQRALKSN